MRENARCQNRWCGLPLSRHWPLWYVLAALAILLLGCVCTTAPVTIPVSSQPNTVTVRLAFDSDSLGLNDTVGGIPIRSLLLAIPMVLIILGVGGAWAWMLVQDYYEQRQATLPQKGNPFGRQ